MDGQAGARTATAAALAGLVGLIIGHATAPPWIPVRSFGSLSSAQIARVGSLTRLVQEARTIVIAEVSSEMRLLSVGSDSGADWRQTARVHEVLKGSVEGPVIKLLRGGMMPGHATSDGDHAPAGPLTPGRSLLFLSGSGAPGVHEVVGHDVGEFPIRDDVVQVNRGPYPIPELELRPIDHAIEAVRRVIRGPAGR